MKFDKATEKKVKKLLADLAKETKRREDRKKKLYQLPVNVWHKIGEVSVDTGALLIADPGYNTKVKNRYWSEKRSVYPFEQLNHAAGHEGAGVVFDSGWGDGQYEVFAKFNKERRVKEVKIVLIEDGNEG